ncbi:MAG TPA: RCC1 domain-containing protein [Streptosporangiaceae bacterium]
MSATRAIGRAAISILAAAVGAIGLVGPGLATAANTPPPTLRGWGINDDSALGNGSLKPDSLVPVKVKLPKRTTVTSVRTGCDFSVARRRTPP